MEHIWNFIRITLYPVGAILVCGFIAWACKRIFMDLLGNNGYKAVIVSSIIGTPIHELGHAAMCLLFGRKIVKLVLWQPRSDDGNLGYVKYTCNSRKLLQRLGNLFISTGPIFSGMAVLSLLLYLVFPNTWSTYVSSVRALVEDNASVLEIVSSGLRMIPNMISEFGSNASPVWVQILSVPVMLSVSLHIDLSPGDIRVARDALSPYLMITLLVTVIATLLGTGVTGLVLSALKSFHVFMMAMFTVVLTFAAAQAALALVIRLFLSLIRK